MKCGNCGEQSEKETSVTFSETVPLPKSKGTTHLVQKVKSQLICIHLLLFDCREN